MWHTTLTTRAYVSPVLYEESTRYLTSHERPVILVDGPREGTQFYRLATEREVVIVRLGDVSAIRVREATPGTSPEDDALPMVSEEGYYEWPG